MNIFISYAHDDKRWLDLLLKPINAAVEYHAPGSRIFTDRRLEAGSYWDDELQKEITDADLIILLGTAAFTNSEYIAKKELPLILRRHRRSSVFPILVTSVAVSHAPQLSAIQWTPSEGLAEHENRPTFDAQLNAISNQLGDRLKKIAGTSARRAISPPMRGREAEVDRFTIDMLDRLISLRDSPLLRISFQGLGHTKYQVEVECMTGSGPISRESFVISHESMNGGQPFCDLIFDNITVREHLLPPAIKAAKDRNVPLRLQVVFSHSALLLDRIDWESMTWNGRPLGYCRDIVFSRQFSFPDADYGELQIKLRSKIGFHSVAVDGQPASGGGDIRWTACFRPDAELAGAFDGIWNWTPQTQVTLFDPLKAAEVVYLRLAAGIDEDDENRIQLSVPDSDGEKLVANSVPALSDQFMKLKADQPSLVILGPRAFRNTEVNQALASSLAMAKVPAVLAPVGNVPEAAWNELMLELLEDLKRHGIIDLAVSVARANAEQSGFGLLLYLRSRSARLWYEPAFVTVKGEQVDAAVVWDALRHQFDPDEASPACVAIVGANLDRTLSLSRRDMAQEMAKTYGFALSSRDREDLETVAEFIHASQPPGEGLSPQVVAFLHAARVYLQRQLKGADRNIDGKDLVEVSRLLRQRRAGGQFDPFKLLGRLRVASFMTVYFHQFIEDELVAQGRTPLSVSFRRPCADLAQTFDASPTVDNPLVYHCFGSFADPRNLLVSKSDYLEFFAEYCLKYDELTVLMRRLLGASTLLILGFRPNSSDLRMLLAVYRMIAGRSRSQKRAHIAVQIDPEDDHTIDPDGARAYYQGLLSELGSNVYLYWGTPEEFLKDFEKNCPHAFVGPLP